MKKPYEAPEMEITRFSLKSDILTSSAAENKFTDDNIMQETVGGADFGWE